MGVSRQTKPIHRDSDFLLELADNGVVLEKNPSVYQCHDAFLKVCHNGIVGSAARIYLDRKHNHFIFDYNRVITNHYRYLYIGNIFPGDNGKILLSIIEKYYSGALVNEEEAKKICKSFDILCITWVRKTTSPVETHLYDKNVLVYYNIIERFINHYHHNTKYSYPDECQDWITFQESERDAIEQMVDDFCNYWIFPPISL